MIFNKKSKQLLLTSFLFFLMINKAQIKIVIFPIFSDTNQKYWVGEKYNIIIKNPQEIKFKKIYLKSENNHVSLDLFGRKMIMKSSGNECLIAYYEGLKESICFHIYNTPRINFNENSPIKLETQASKKLALNTYDYPKSNIKYRSNNPGIIKVNKEGEIKALRPGIAYISAVGLDNTTITIKVISLANNGLINNYSLVQLNITLYDNLMIVAHPDDEILWGGANLYKDKYFIVCLTNGYNHRAYEFLQVLNFTQSGGIILNYTDLQDNFN
jgi:hypothetical protein